MPALDYSKITLQETDKDRDFLLQLFISTRSAELLHSGWTQQQIEPFLTQQFAAQHQSFRQLYPRADYKLVLFAREPVGRLYLHRNEAGDRLIDIALIASCRNGGLGSHLIQTILDSASENGSPVSLHVEHMNPAYRLYQRLGFERVKDCGPYLLMRWLPPNHGHESPS